MDTIYCKTSSTAAPLRIRLLETPPDGRLDFVVILLDKIAENRFGPGCLLIDVDSLEEVFEPEREIQFDLTAVRHARCTSPHVSEGVTSNAAG